MRKDSIISIFEKQINYNAQKKIKNSNPNLGFDTEKDYIVAKLSEKLSDENVSMEEKVSTIYEIRKIHGSDKFDVRIPNFGKIKINLFLKSIVYDSLISGDLELKGDFISINSGGIEYNSIKEITFPIPIKSKYVSDKEPLWKTTEEYEQLKPLLRPVMDVKIIAEKNNDGYYCTNTYKFSDNRELKDSNLINYKGSYVTEEYEVNPDDMIVNNVIKGNLDIEIDSERKNYYPMIESYESLFNRKTNKSYKEEFNKFDKKIVFLANLYKALFIKKLNTNMKNKSI